MAVDVAQLLSFTVKNNASDLHLSGGVPPMIRVDGDIKRINMPALTHKDVNSMVYDIMNDKQRKDYEEFLETDFSFEIPKLARFPRQRLQPEPRFGGRVSYHSLGDPDAGRPRCAADLQGHLDASAWHRAGDGPDRFR